MSAQSDHLISELARILLKDRASQRDQVIMIKAYGSSDPLVHEKLVPVWKKHVTDPFTKWAADLTARDSLDKPPHQP